MIMMCGWFRYDLRLFLLRTTSGNKLRSYYDLRVVKESIRYIEQHIHILNTASVEWVDTDVKKRVETHSGRHLVLVFHSSKCDTPSTLRH